MLTLAATDMATAACNNAIPKTTPDNAFTLHNNGTVTHNKTGLMWMRCLLGQTWDGNTCSSSSQTYEWSAALQAADGYSFAAYSNWRLPNKNELASIVEEACYSPAINTLAFPNTPTSASWADWSSSAVWSSTPAEGYHSGYANSNFVWYVDFGYGIVGAYTNGGNLLVRLVRGGEQIDNLLLPPSNVKASDGTYSERVVVTWLGTVGAEDYEIWQGSNANSSEAVRVAAEVTVTSYNDTTVPYGSSYFWVKACNNSRCSDFSVPDTGYPALIPQ